MKAGPCLDILPGAGGGLQQRVEVVAGVGAVRQAAGAQQHKRQPAAFQQLLRLPLELEHACGAGRLPVNMLFAVLDYSVCEIGSPAAFQQLHRLPLELERACKSGAAFNNRSFVAKGTERYRTSTYKSSVSCQMGTNRCSAHAFSAVCATHETVSA